MARNENDDRSRWSNETGADRRDERNDDRDRDERWQRLRRGGDAAGGEMWHGRDRDIGYAGGMGSWGARDQYGQGSDGWNRSGEQWGGGRRDESRGGDPTNDWRGREQGNDWRSRDRGDEWRGREQGNEGRGREHRDDWRGGERDAYSGQRWGRHTANWGEGAGTERFRGEEAGWGGYGSYDRESLGGGWRRAGESRRDEERPHWPADRRGDWRDSDRGGRSQAGGGNWSYAGYGAAYSGGFGGEYGGGYDQREANNQDWTGGGASDWRGEERRREDMGRRWDQGTLHDQDRYRAPRGQGGDWRGGEGRGHAGRGPKSYQRSDERIREDIIQRLTDHPDIDASDIDVEVKSCEVILRGNVDDRHAKHLAEDIADRVWGVRDVRNEIRVQRQESGSSGGAAAFHSGSTSYPTLTAPGGEMPRPAGQEQTTGVQEGSNAGEAQPRSSETRQNVSSGDQGTRSDQLAGNKR